MTELEGDVSTSNTKTGIKIGDEIVKVCKKDIVSTSAYNILTKPLPTEDYKGTVVVDTTARDGTSLGGLIANLVATEISTASTDYVPIAQRVI